MTENRDPRSEINANDWLGALAFSANGEYLISGGANGVRVWRVEDGQEIAVIEARTVSCLAVSADDKWIAAGTRNGEIFVWDAETHEAVFMHWGPDIGVAWSIDFSPDSTRLVTASRGRTASVWDISQRKAVLGLQHEREVIAAKYSPQGDRIATAASFHESIRVYDSNSGRLLVDIPLGVNPSRHTCLLWSNTHIFAASDAKIKKIDASTGIPIAEWPATDYLLWFSSPRNGEFMACSTDRTITFWDTETHAQLSLIQHPQVVRSMTLSPDGRFVAIAGDNKKITMKRLSRIIEPEILVDDSVLNPWKLDQLEITEASLEAVIPISQNTTHHALACRALIRARLRKWDAAITDAEKSIRIQPSIIGYVAKAVVLVGKEEKFYAYRTCDIAFERFRSSRVSFLLLVKAIIVFVAGDHDDAISRVDDLIDTVHFNAICYVVQAYMHLLLGNACMERGNLEGAIQSLQHARTKVRSHTSRVLMVVSLIFGWNFDNLAITIQRQLCEALYAAGRAKEAGDLIVETAITFDRDIYVNEATIQWISTFTQRCLSTPGCDDYAVQNYSSPIVGPPIPSPLLREWVRAKLTSSPWKDALTATAGFTAPKFIIYRAICEYLETIDRTLDASECSLQMEGELADEITLTAEHAKWVADFRQFCAEKLEHLGDTAVDAKEHKDAIIQYSAALSLNLPIPHVFVKRSKVYMVMGLWKNALDDVNRVITLDPSSPWGYEKVLEEWGKVNLMNGLWKDALSAARDFKVPRLTIYRILCQGLEKVGGVMDAIECFHQMTSELTEETMMQGEQAEWVLDFRYRCSQKLERFGDASMDNERHEEAIEHYSTALSIHPVNTRGFFTIRSKVCIAKGLLEDAIEEAKQAVTLDPSSPWGYEVMHAALHRAGRYDDSVQAFETMLSKMAQSTDPQTREKSGQYNTPSTIRATIRNIIQRTIRHSPRVLINTTTGRLQSKTEQASTFMSFPMVNELISSMTTHINHGRIKREVRHFFRYVVLSHKWEDNEPLFHHVKQMAVYDLVSSSTHDKLQTFCRIARDAGFNWAWSDTCCIDKQDHFVLQEALVAMFKWYRGAAMMIVFLRGVHSPSRIGDLAMSVWNTRGWTLQEYVAAKVIHFYTEDWTPYLGLDTFNHKESPEIVSEMEQATGVSAQHLTALRPGLSSIREKLRLASTRQTALVEDAAYSLLGIFSIAGIPAIYGEGEDALGRLLSHLLAGSGDASILAWTGQSGGYNSCLPARITVFSHPASSHVPPPINDADMMKVMTTLSTSESLELDLALKLYNRLEELPAPWFAASRMKLPCIAFKLPSLSPYRTHSGRVYRTDTLAFGMVEIKTRQDPSRLGSLYLVHPWLDALLDREDTGMQSDSAWVDDDDMDVAEPASSPNTDDDMSDGDVEEEEDLVYYPSSPGADNEGVSEKKTQGHVASLTQREAALPRPIRTNTDPMDRETRALRLVARLRQPFGALLLSLTSTRRRAVVYRRVAADSTITVQLRENVPLSDVLDNVRILDVL